MENPDLDARLGRALVDPSALGEFVDSFVPSPLLVPMHIDGETAYPIVTHRDDGPAVAVFTGSSTACRSTCRPPTTWSS